MYFVEIEVPYRDIDMFGHLNNSAVCSYLETARVKYYLERFHRFDATYVIAKAEIQYLKPVYLGEVVVIYLRISSIGRTSWEYSYEIKKKQNGIVAVRAKTVQVWFDFGKKKKKPIPTKVAKVLREDASEG
jgi:acyl-CoA thioester hydrolase